MRFSELAEDVVYYGIYATLFEDSDYVLWIEDHFQCTMRNIGFCTAHTIPVQRKGDALYHVDMPLSVKIQHNVGRAVIATLCRLANPLPIENREYTARTLPIGRWGYMTSWALALDIERNLTVHENMAVEAHHYHVNDALVVLKDDDKHLLVDRTSYDKASRKHIGVRKNLSDSMISVHVVDGLWDKIDEFLLAAQKIEDIDIDADKDVEALHHLTIWFGDTGIAAAFRSRAQSNSSEWLGALAGLHRSFVTFCRKVYAGQMHLRIDDFNACDDDTDNQRIT